MCLHVVLHNVCSFPMPRGFLILAFVVVVCLCFGVSVLLHTLGWLITCYVYQVSCSHRDQPASASLVLGWKMYATTSGLKNLNDIYFVVGVSAFNCWVIWSETSCGVWLFYIYGNSCSLYITHVCYMNSLAKYKTKQPIWIHNAE